MSDRMISPDEARAILDEAMIDRLGADWQDDEDGWKLVTGHDFMARVVKGRACIDFYVDLLGQVTVEEKMTGPGPHTGRLLAWMILGLSLAIAMLIARIVGWL